MLIFLPTIGAYSTEVILESKTQTREYTVKEIYYIRENNQLVCWCNRETDDTSYEVSINLQDAILTCDDSRNAPIITEKTETKEVRNEAGFLYYGTKTVETTSYEIVFNSSFMAEVFSE